MPLLRCFYGLPGDGSVKRFRIIQKVPSTLLFFLHLCLKSVVVISCNASLYTNQESDVTSVYI